jgi:hypothetical protein
MHPPTVVAELENQVAAEAVEEVNQRIGIETKKKRYWYLRK